ncbi:MAG: multiubiquitin domain-containing protein [Verrucomicrobiota bacterium]|jgi:hypothetical protein
MPEIELHVHTHEGAEPKLIKISSDATVEQLVKEIQAAGAAIGEPGEEIILWVENEEITCRKGHKIHECRIKHGHHVHCHCVIIVNTKEKRWDKKEISYEELVILSVSPNKPDPNILYSITYSKGPEHHREGSLAKGKSVKVKCGMIFNVYPTNKS